ncbi:MAG: sugar phosphate nucleotidyltransferase [Candidatus Cryptobacteroides sp.]|uniref:sugar phosphate nucleotidyltransferase n=1 Tax=Candidatus Cryptobacteroides sp. TaxID=2952915 RepID=UPI002A9110F5|nr:sugar phosphate nucleotidyltransferase [Candidatus Cryptobacteroides sp.]MDY5566530.1 sugar phosphate nucleotidyltransferase [Candidatus Cryptobacteroides sp.]
MQLVLLSGGSGKRLWPLSNNARSKQFLPLLEKEDGTMESMVQRVVRQVREAHLTDDITLATNASQLDIIINQLGDSVSVVTEPERRDTFPAIALASGYLKLKKGCPDDEVVVIMPCDPFTESGYFETIGKMVRCVEADVAELVLMGITPTYPSEKYGYVVPVTDHLMAEGSMAVSKFTEKPNVERAKELLAMGALWNGGVFAFRLGYMMEIAQRYVKADSFEEMRSRYSEFPKISFDYEVAEKADSVAVLPYSGQWKDLGTWNTLTDELHHHIIGNAVMGPRCTNTHVINELQYPIYVDGMEGTVIAASPDGIIVCRKKYTEDIKKAVDHLTPRPMYEERRWGSYRVIDDTTYADGRHSLTKSLTINAGKNISYQVHRHRSEAWTIVEGEGIFVLDGVERKVGPGETVVIPVNHYHALKALTTLTFIEVQTGNPLVEEDIERSEWKWSE